MSPSEPYRVARCQHCRGLVAVPVGRYFGHVPCCPGCMAGVLPYESPKMSSLAARIRMDTLQPGDET